MSHLHAEKIHQALEALQNYAKGQDTEDFFKRKARVIRKVEDGKRIKVHNKLRGPKVYKFEETMELQVGLKGIDIKRDPRFKVPVVLHNLPKTNTKIIVLADENDMARCEKAGIPYKAFAKLPQEFDKTKPAAIKRFAKSYDVILCSKSQIKNIVKVFGPNLTKCNRQPLPLETSEDLIKKCDEIKRTITVAFKKNMGLSWPIGKISEKPEDLQKNVVQAVNILTENLKKGWQNVKSIHLTTTMGPSKKIF